MQETLATTMTSRRENRELMVESRNRSILGLMAVAILTQIPGASTETKFITVTVTVIITSLLTGIFFLIIGGFKLGRFVRFIPYPVVGGFIAGTGLLLVEGAIGVMIGAQPSTANLNLLLVPENLLRWVPSVVFGIALVIGSRRFQHLWTPMGARKSFVVNRRFASLPTV